MTTTKTISIGTATPKESQHKTSISEPGIYGQPESEKDPRDGCSLEGAVSTPPPNPLPKHLQNLLHSSLCKPALSSRASLGRSRGRSGNFQKPLSGAGTKVLSHGFHVYACHFIF